MRFGGTREAPAGITRTLGWATGLSFATAFTQLPDGRLLVTLQAGQLRVVQSDGTLLAAPMLSLASVDSSGERGLLGVTAHPQLRQQRLHLCLLHHHGRRVAQPHQPVHRQRQHRERRDRAGATCPCCGRGHHNGGALQFGIDGKLYVAVGDNSVSDRAQNLNSVFGKMLRFNEDGTIPSDNPHCTTQGNLACAVWARGLRNPFTLAVQPGTGRIFINDVGEHAWEEINLGAPGRTSAGLSPKGPPP